MQTALSSGGGLWTGPLDPTLAGALDVSGSSTPGSSAPGSSTPGSSTPGSSTPGSSTPGSSTPGDWTHSLPEWMQTVLFHDWFTGQDGRGTDTSVRSLLVLLAFVALGAGFIYFGVKTLAE